ncbi:hypothetical protein TNCV_1797761 [Trichonephila clavipes]|nr:hypothetical protein TNCV_1797761 [Trichonephila clavipes]
MNPDEEGRQMSVTKYYRDKSHVIFHRIPTDDVVSRVFIQCIGADGRHQSWHRQQQGQTSGYILPGIHVQWLGEIGKRPRCLQVPWDRTPREQDIQFFTRLLVFLGRDSDSSLVIMLFDLLSMNIVRKRMTIQTQKEIMEQQCVEPNSGKRAQRDEETPKQIGKTRSRLLMLLWLMPPV